MRDRGRVLWLLICKCLRGMMKAFVGAVAGLFVLSGLLAPSATAKEPKNYEWDDIQVISATAGCGNTVSASRYGADGQLLGSRELITAAPRVQVKPLEYDFRTLRKPRNFLFQTFDCDLKKSRLYTWNLADKNSSPRLIVDLPASDTLFDAAFDPASQNVVYLRWGDSGDQSVEMVPPTGGPSTRLWALESSNVGISPTTLLMNTGGEFSLLGRAVGEFGVWVQLGLNARTPMAPGYVVASGPGEIEDAAVGTFPEFKSGTVYVANSSRAWLCTSPRTAMDVEQDRNCVEFRPVSQSYLSAQVGWSFGSVRASDSSDLLYWTGSSQNYVQPVSVDPTGLPRIGELMPLQGGPGANGLTIIAAADFDRAIDNFKVKTFRAG